jgi:hypothetical protein
VRLVLKGTDFFWTSAVGVMENRCLASGQVLKQSHKVLSSRVGVELVLTLGENSSEKRELQGTFWQVVVMQLL